MTTYTTILHAPQVAPNQNQKEATINTAMAILEGAMNDKIALSLAAGNRTLTTDEFTKYFHQVYSGQTAARVVTIPNTVRMFAASNTGTFDITLHCNGSAGLDLVVVAGTRVLVLSDGTDVIAITSGVNRLQDLSDTLGLGAASQGQLLGYDATAGKWEPVDAAADLPFFVTGAPSASQKVYRRAVTRNMRLLSDFSGSQGKADTAATASTVFNVYKGATLVGTITFAASGTTPTFSTNTGSGSTSVTLAPGDVVTVQAPASPDATLADIVLTLKGVYL